MNKGVQILLERMSSNPDEFVPEMPLGAVGRKWRDIIEAVHDRIKGRVGDAPYFDLKFLSDEEVLAIHTKLQEIRGDLFTKDIMARLLADDSSREASTDSVGGGLKGSHRYAQGWTTTANFSKAIQSSIPMLDEQKKRELYEMLEAYEIAREKEKLEQMKRQAKATSK